MSLFVNVVAVLAGLLGILFYFRSIVRVMLLNRREPDIVEQVARHVAVSAARIFCAGGRDTERLERAQAWILPLFILVAVVSWFLLVQLSFSFILLGLKAEASWPHAFSSSGSALSTLGYLTPPTLLGEYLATYEAAIGLAIVTLLFTFVPGYKAAIQTRERRVGWLYARTGSHPSCSTLLAALMAAGRLDDNQVWRDWEAWFRGIVETHSLSPVLAYVPSVYRGTTWVASAAAVLDTASFALSSLDLKRTVAIRICRETGILALSQLSEELGKAGMSAVVRGEHPDASTVAAFDGLYAHLAGLGLPLKADREKCRDAFMALRSEYLFHLDQVAKATMMPVEEPWYVPEVAAPPHKLTKT